ncbi:hypothetical protein [Vibrio sp. C8]
MGFWSSAWEAIVEAWNENSNNGESVHDKILDDLNKSDSSDSGSDSSDSSDLGPSDSGSSDSGSSDSGSSDSGTNDSSSWDSGSDSSYY